MFNDDTSVAGAMLDRLLHHSTVRSIDGDSYRMRAHRDAVAKVRRAVAAGGTASKGYPLLFADRASPAHLQRARLIIFGERRHLHEKRSFRALSDRRRPGIASTRWAWNGAHEIFAGIERAPTPEHGREYDEPTRVNRDSHAALGDGEVMRIPGHGLLR